jgi:hypothetical protein
MAISKGRTGQCGCVLNVINFQSIGQGLERCLQVQLKTV